MPYVYSTSQDAANANIQTAQAYVAGKGFDILPEANFWAGKRYYGRSDIYITDTKYTQLNGNGAGVDNIDVHMVSWALRTFAAKRVYSLAGVPPRG